MILVNNDNLFIASSIKNLDNYGAHGEGWFIKSFTTENAKLIDEDAPHPIVPYAWQWDEATQTWLEFDSAAIELVRNPPIDIEKVKQEITDATSKRLDAFAQTSNYDSILSACTYATSTVLQFAKEGQYCVGMRDATWAKLYQIMQEVEAGTRPMPTGYADIESELPVLDWGNA